MTFWKSTFWCRLAVLAVVAASGRAQASTWLADETRGLIEVTGKYTNSNYGFSVVIPAGAHAFMQSPPSPNHGVRLVLGDNRIVEVSASFDAPLYGSTHTLMSALLRQAPPGERVRTVLSLGGLPAERVTVRVGSSVWDTVAQRRPQPDGDAVNVECTLQTTVPQDELSFAAVLKSFTVEPRLP